MGLQSKLLIYAAIGGLLALMGYFVYHASLDNPQLEQVEIDLFSVEVLEVNNVENRAILEVTFLVSNPSDKTFTIPSITYELTANGNSIGQGKYSTEDISMPGRAAFYPGSEISLTNIFQLVLSDTNAPQYQAIIKGEPVQYTVKGIVTVETAWSLVEKDCLRGLSRPG